MKTKNETERPAGAVAAPSSVIRVAGLFIADEHCFRGHHGSPPGDSPMMEVREIACDAGRGIRGDRYYDHQADFKGQITFFEDETYHRLCDLLDVRNKPASVFRRNVLVRGVKLSSLIGQEFEVQGVRFVGAESCSPCYWMDRAFGPGAESAMKDCGGLRARILTDGILRVDA